MRTYKVFQVWRRPRHVTVRMKQQLAKRVDREVRGDVAVLLKVEDEFGVGLGTHLRLCEWSRVDVVARFRSCFLATWDEGRWLDLHNERTVFWR